MPTGVYPRTQLQLEQAAQHMHLWHRYLGTYGKPVSSRQQYVEWVEGQLPAGGPAPTYKPHILDFQRFVDLTHHQAIDRLCIMCGRGIDSSILGKPLRHVCALCIYWGAP